MSPAVMRPHIRCNQPVRAFNSALAFARDAWTAFARVHRHVVEPTLPRHRQASIEIIEAAVGAFGGNDSSTRQG